MKRIIGLTTAALMSASMLAAPAMAQTATGGASGSATTETGVTGDVNSGAAGTATDTTKDAAGAASGTATGTMDDTDSTATGAIATDATFDGALAAIEGNATSTTALETMTEVGSVEVIKIGELEGADMAALETAKTESSAEITALQAAIEANTAVSAALEAEAVEADTVVATETSADGTLVVYVE